MRKLASNATAALMKCRSEYWVVIRKEPTERCPDGWDTSAINEQSDTFRASNALRFFEEHYGPATWIRSDIVLY